MRTPLLAALSSIAALSACHRTEVPETGQSAAGAYNDATRWDDVSCRVTVSNANWSWCFEADEACAAAARAGQCDNPNDITPHDLAARCSREGHWSNFYYGEPGEIYYATCSELPGGGFTSSCHGWIYCYDCGHPGQRCCPTTAPSTPSVNPPAPIPPRCENGATCVEEWTVYQRNPPNPGGRPHSYGMSWNCNSCGGEGQVCCGGQDNVPRGAGTCNEGLQCQGTQVDWGDGYMGTEMRCVRPAPPPVLNSTTAPPLPPPPAPQPDANGCYPDQRAPDGCSVGSWGCSQGVWRCYEAEFEYNSVCPC